jgi:hypothetical protein
MVCFLLRTLSFETSEWHFDPVDGLCGHVQLCPYGMKNENSPTASGENPEPARRLLSGSTDELAAGVSHQDQGDPLT